MAGDKAHAWTDRELKRLERKINSEYTKAYKEMKAQMSEISAKLAANPNMSLQQKMAAMNKYNRLENLCAQMAETLKDTNATAQKFVSQSMQNVYKTNYNFVADQLGFSILDNTAVKNILTGEVNPFAKLSISAGKDKAAIMRKLQSEMTTAILKGESIPKISKRLKTVAESYLGDTVRIARTETTRIENSARQSVGDEGVKKGFNMWKRWSATGDERTRDEHLAADGQEVPSNEPFTVGGEQMMYPGDISLGASAWNTINCFDGDVNVFNNNRALKSYKHSYSGKMLIVKTASGIEFTVTPNHPILTDRGWISVTSLNKGDNIIIGGVAKNNLVGFTPNEKEIPTKFSTFHDLFKVMGTFKRISSINGNFHGDIADSDVEVVTLKRFLPNRFISFCGKKIKDFFFSIARFIKQFFSGNGFKHIFSFGRLNVSSCDISGMREPLLFSKRSLRHAIKHGLRTIANSDVVFTQDTINNLSANIISNRKLFNRLPAYIGFDKIVSVDTFVTTSHIVYNLQTKNNLYLANSISQNNEKCNHIGAIFHNCRCSSNYFIKEKGVETTYKNKAIEAERERRKR